MHSLLQLNLRTCLIPKSVKRIVGGIAKITDAIIPGTTPTRKM